MFLQDCAEIADFFTELVDAVGDVSLQLQGDDTVQVVDGMVHPYKGKGLGCGVKARRAPLGPCHRCKSWVAGPSSFLSYTVFLH